MILRLDVGEEIYELHARLCKSFSNPIRLKVLDLLRSGEKSVKELLAATGASQPNLSLHLKSLRANGVLARRQAGTMAYYRVADPEVFEAIDILQRILSKKLAREGRLARRRIRS